MNVHIILLLLTTFLISHAASGAEVKPPWKVVETRLVNDDQEAEIVLERTFPQQMYDAQFEAKRVRVFVSSLNSFLKYKPESISPKTLIFDTSKTDEIQKITAILKESIRINSIVNGRVNGRSRNYTLGQLESKLTEYSGALGHFKITYRESSGSENYAGAIRLQGEEPENYIFVEEPSALAFALDSISEFRKLHTSAIAEKERQIALQKKTEEETAKREIEMARAAAEQRRKEAEEQERKTLAKMRIEDQWEAIRKQGEQDAAAIREKSRQLQRKKVRDFFAAKEGKQLGEEITKLVDRLAAEDKRVRSYDREYLSREGQISRYRETLGQGLRITAKERATTEKLLDAALDELKAFKSKRPDWSKFDAVKVQLQGKLGELERTLGITIVEAVNLLREGNEGLREGNDAALYNLYLRFYEAMYAVELLK